MTLLIESISANEMWFEFKHRADVLRRYRAWLHPGLAAELAELEQAGY